ncbi:complex I subunit 4 family protein [Mucilaginibacter sp. X4EP1]|uniref:complex I subunit 4 family protein n=1 Tax=Mucilaginibacter sp. X4EP1 TaxID=2723092 RepID=UPI00216933D6|nr:NADH-quinone oxidoreductase subunit M [Mucilaginibacter sp. X4EP1]MCS3812101.1 NADH-quinone oxidoreductase subunit M [Mucilaginibacter sp. X4EP1]
MILAGLIILLMGCGVLAWLAGRWNNTLPRIISLFGISIQLLVVVWIWLTHQQGSVTGQWIMTYTHSWIPAFGIQIKFGIDGLSLLMIALTAFLGLLSVLTSWKEINNRVGFFHFNLLFVLAGITGVFLSLDLFLFYFSWEVMLIPMYFLISIWGNENRTYASYKFFLFTQGSGLLMFLSILGLYLIHGHNTGIFTFDYEQLLGTVMQPQTAFLLMLGFVLAFIVKLSTVPFHSWLPDAHTQAPTAGSVILAGLLLKTGVYGLIRFVLPLFPQASHQFAPVAMVLGVVSILYGAKLAFAQTDLKRLIAYISVSHMGFILLGIYAFNEMAMQGVVMQMVAHGISTGALFIIAGTLHERIQTRDLGQMGGLWAKIPKMGALGLVFVMASLGFPGLGNFVAEFLILNGSFMANQKLTIIATLGLVAATIYALRIMQKVFYGKEQKTWVIADFSIREMGIMITLVIAVVWMGLFPSAVLTVSRPSVLKVIESVADRKAQTREAQLHRQTTLEQNITMTGASLPGHHWNTNSKKAN